MLTDIMQTVTVTVATMTSHGCDAQNRPWALNILASIVPPWVTLDKRLIGRPLPEPTVTGTARPPVPRPSPKGCRDASGHGLTPADQYRCRLWFCIGGASSAVADFVAQGPLQQQMDTTASSDPHSGSVTHDVKITNGTCSPPLKRTKLPDQQLELEAFDSAYNAIVTDCLDSGKALHPEIGDAIKHFMNVCNYNVPHGKKNRGLSVVNSYRFLVPDASNEDLHRARVLGWCVEWLQAYFLVADDIMDHSVTRRGQPCWYKRDGIGMMAINDSFYLEAAIYEILKKYFRSQAYYIDIVDLFHETTMQTVLGQGLDLLTADESIVDFSRFTAERYNAIVKWKTAFYSFYLPVALAMHLAGITDEKAFTAAKAVLLEMGHFFQVQDDYLDCFGDPAVTGKIGTDIEDNKCSWLITTALACCTDEQRRELEANYAQRDPVCVARVKALYSELGMERLYAEFEEQSYARLLELTKGLETSLHCGDTGVSTLPKQMFIAFADKIYKRLK